MDKSQQIKSSTILTTAVFIVFLFLKLANMGTVANWSWWWVTSPLWLPFVLYVLGFIVFVIVSAIREELD